VSLRGGLSAAVLLALCAAAAAVFSHGPAGTQGQDTTQAEVEVRGVAGSISLPRGAGPLLPLLAALQWIHLGKSTVVGLGQLSIRPGMPRTD